MSTLALNMIVGPGESEILYRCLTSFDAKNNFDEIVIVNTSCDEQVNEVAHLFTENVFFFQWENEEHPYGDFGGARNCAIDYTKSDKIFWLDTDDVLLKQHKNELFNSLRLIKDDTYKNIMIWTIPYAIIVDKSGNIVSWFKRERVFDRKAIRWNRTVHELMCPGTDLVEHAAINGLFITHMPMKTNETSAARNIRMLEWDYARDPDDVQTKYFLGRDYMYGNNADKGINLLNAILSDLATGHEMLYAIASDLAYYYAYGCTNIKPSIDQMNKENLLKIESYCRLALSVSFDFADPYILLGDIYYHRNDIDSSYRMYQTALKKKIGIGKFQNNPMYREIPAARLSIILEIQGKLGLSYHYNEVMKEFNMDAFKNRKQALMSLMSKSDE
jgi:glycosyltransferase involved in cell wall biosynthesis